MNEPTKKTTAAHSLMLAKKVRGMIKDLARKTHEAKAAGEPVAYLFIAGAYDDILRAMDIATVGTENYAGVCAAKMDAERFLSKAEEEGYARHLCTYATVGLGFDAIRKELGEMPENAPDGGMAFPTIMLGTGMNICDPRYKWYQAAQRYNDAPMHVLGLLNPPVYGTHTDLEDYRSYYIEYVTEELRELVRRLEKVTGKRMDRDRLSQVVDLSERTLTRWYEAYQLRKAVPAPMPTEDALSTMVPGNFMLGTQEAYDFYSNLYDELKHRVDSGIGTIEDEKYRLLWGLSLPPWYALTIFNYFESQGAVFPIEAVYNQGRDPEIPDTVTDPLERIARRFYGSMTRYHEKARANTGHTTVEWLLDLIDDYKCDAVVFHQAMTCRTVHTGQLNQINTFKKYSDKPILLLEGDIVDVRNYDEPTTRQRVDAFLEVVDSHKRSSGG
jgi:benzoyl-CoA reductase/2-hydroxyglutaryl-CoA dehydratase subunit BcrC/BadD/HgdB